MARGHTQMNPAAWNQLPLKPSPDLKDAKALLDELNS